VIIVLVLRSLSRSRSEIPSHRRREKENENEKDKIAAPIINQIARASPMRRSPHRPIRLSASEKSAPISG
jgi:hypothetical protein